MGKGAPEETPAPDPYATARAQTNSNVSTAIANTALSNANETGPLGSVRYNQTGTYKLSEPVLDANGAPVNNRRWVSDDPSAALQAAAPGSLVPSYETGANGGPGMGVGHWVEDPSTTTREIPLWERITTLSPEQQALYDKTNTVQQKFLDIANSQAGRLESSLGTPLNFDNVPDYTKGVLAKLLSDDGSASRGRVEDALTQRLNPQLERDRAALENQLVNQGFTRGTEAFQNELDSANRQSNDARLGVIAAGGQEQALQQQLMMQQLAAAGTSRDRSIQELMAQRNAPINEISALLGQSQVSMPQFSPYQAGTIANTPVGDYVYKSADITQRNDAAASKAASESNAGLFKMGSSAMSMLPALFALSDRRAKTGIRPAGTLRNGLPLYVYRYRGDDEEQLGLMADEVEALRPEAVREIDGLKHVNYELAVL